MIWAAAIVNQQGRPQGSPYGGHVVGAPLVVAPTLGPLVCPPVDQCLDLGQDSRDSIDLGLEPDDTLELRCCDLHLSLQLADAGPKVGGAPGRYYGLTDDRHDEGERHLLVEMPLPVFSLAHEWLTGLRCGAQKARPHRWSRHGAENPGSPGTIASEGASRKMKETKMGIVM